MQINLQRKYFFYSFILKNNKCKQNKLPIIKIFSIIKTHRIIQRKRYSILVHYGKKMRIMR